MEKKASHAKVRSIRGNSMKTGSNVGHHRLPWIEPGDLLAVDRNVKAACTP